MPAMTNAYAYQEETPQQENFLAEEATDEPLSNADENNIPQQQEEESMQQKTFLTEEPADEPVPEEEVNDIPTPQEEAMQQETSLEEEAEGEPVPYADADVLDDLGTDAVHDKMIALKTKYPEGTPFTNFTPYNSNNLYRFKGGKVLGAGSGVGCAGFAFELSDAAFGSLPARTLMNGQFSLDGDAANGKEAVRVGDILRIWTGVSEHSVIVLKKNSGGVIVAEANYNKSVHWGRVLPKNVVESSFYIVTRYPKGYTAEDEDADKVFDNGKATGDFENNNLHWELTNGGTLTISGSGKMPDFDLNADSGETGYLPWKAYLDKIQKVVIEEGVTSIGANAFSFEILGEGTSNLLSVSIPDTVTSIGEKAFYESAIIYVDIPASVKSIGNKAFIYCTNLVSVNFSEKAKEKEEDKNEGLETIGECAFQGCLALESIVFPASVKSVGSGAFMQCSDMTSAIFLPKNNDDEAVTLGENLFTKCERMTSVTLPKKIDSMGAGMFQNCTLLYRIDVPEGVDSIGASAFTKCGLREITIPKDVKTIGSSAFTGASNLQHIYFGGSETEWGKVDKKGDTSWLTSSINIHYTDKSISTPEITVSALESDKNADEEVKKVSVSIETNTADATIYYTTDGTEPTKSYTTDDTEPKKYKGPFEIKERYAPVIIKAIAVDDDGNSFNLSEVALKEVEFNTEAEITVSAPEITVSKPEAENGEKVSVTIAASEENAKIYYTKDGTEPTESSAEYTAPFDITGTDETITIKAITVVGGKASETAAKVVEFLDATGIKHGDVNGDDNITVDDAALLIKKVRNKDKTLPIEEKTDEYMKYVDVDNDGKLTSTDAALIVKKALNSNFAIPVKK